MGAWEAEVRGELLGFPVPVRVGDFGGLEPELLPEVAHRDGALEGSGVDGHPLQVINDPQAFEDIVVREPGTEGEEGKMDERLRGWVV